MEKTEKFDWENDAREKQKQEIASIKGRELVLRLSDQDVEEICELTGRYGTTVEELLENFVGDLIDGTMAAMNMNMHDAGLKDVTLECFRRQILCRTC